MGTMVGFTEAKLLVLAKENTPRGRNAQKEIDRRKAKGTWQTAAEATAEAAPKPKTRRRKKAVKSEVTVKTDVEETEQETSESE